MKNFKRIILVSIIVALSSQISIGLMISDFMVSAGIIFLVSFLFYYENLPPVKLALVSGVMVYLSRVTVYYITQGNIEGVLTSYLFEIIFYVFYSIVYAYLIRKKNKENLKFAYFILIISDFTANFLEVFARSLFEISPPPFQVVYTLFLVSLIRSSIIWLVLNGLKYYRMFLIKEEHEERYKRLLWLISKLKTEMYWLEKNMDNIEKVMNESYRLFEKINNNEDRDSWGNSALTIAKEVHEIKKENGLAIRGIRAATRSELVDEGINYKDIVNILSETMKREISHLGKNIALEFNVGMNFYTNKHYYLMSLLRNLIMNSIDAIPDNKKDGAIRVSHIFNNNVHQFVVADNGTGIEHEEIRRIFSPGFSTKINYDTGEINRGLGLSIVKYIVEEQLKGKIDVVSKKDEGTSFEISIPKETLEEM